MRASESVREMKIIVLPTRHAVTRRRNERIFAPKYRPTQMRVESNDVVDDDKDMTV